MARSLIRKLRFPRRRLAGLLLPVLVLHVMSPTALGQVRLATFNAALSPARHAAHLDAVAAVIRANDPDVLLLNEVDHNHPEDPLGELQNRLIDAEGMPTYPHVFVAAVNTGHPSGFDLDGDGDATGPADAWGYGAYPGQYGMAVLSKFPIDADAARTFRTLKWRDRPGHRMPADFYAPAAAANHPLSSKSHWDVPIRIGDHSLHLLASHPTPPVFDGPEDRNGRRNADEIGFWVDYLSPDRDRWIIDDAGQRGGLAPGALCVVAGDLNNDPDEGDGDRAAITALLNHPRLADDPSPVSVGATAAGLDADDTAGWGKRVDYVLPSRKLAVVDSGVYWPAPGQPGADEAADASDHRLVWVDVRLPPQSGN